MRCLLARCFRIWAVTKEQSGTGHHFNGIPGLLPGLWDPLLLVDLTATWNYLSTSASSISSFLACIRRCRLRSNTSFEQYGHLDFLWWLLHLDWVAGVVCDVEVASGGPTVWGSMTDWGVIFFFLEGEDAVSLASAVSAFGRFFDFLLKFNLKVKWTKFFTFGL